MIERSEVPHKEAWYNHWYVPGVIAFTGGLTVLCLEAILRKSNVALPVIGPVSLLLSLLVFSLGWNLERHRKAIEEIIRRESLELERRLHLDLVRIGAEVAEPYLLYLRDQMFLSLRRPMLQLVDKGRSLKTVRDCTAKLIEAIEALDKRVPEVLAICGKKAWDDPDVKEYYKTNYQKSLEGTKIKRIFIQEHGKIFSEVEKKVLETHLSDEYPNVEARVIFAEDLQHLAEYRLPPGFGFAILGGTVIVHWGLGKNVPEAGRRFDDPWLIEEHRQIFWRLWRNIAKGATEEERARINNEILGAPPPNSGATPDANRASRGRRR
jgi:hypothetical protein